MYIADTVEKINLQEKNNKKHGRAIQGLRRI